MNQELHSRRESGDAVPEKADSSTDREAPRAGKRRVLAVFGTRPEVIKLAPVLRAMQDFSPAMQTLTAGTGQHTDLLYPFLDLFGIQLDFDLRVMRPDQTPNEVCARVLTGLDPILTDERPDLILVQGDTTTALAGALAGFYRRIPVGHVEAGLRSGDPSSPFPEEMNRRLISRLATYHFAATEGNRSTLLDEGVPGDRIYVTGNPVVDSLNAMLARTEPSESLKPILTATAGQRLIVLTTHRRESFGQVMRQHLRDLRRFVELHPDVSLVFAVHPNPNVAEVARAELQNSPRIHLIAPLDYTDFIQLMRNAWVLVSDSGGIQEEAPTLKKPLFVLRENTERREAVDAGVAILVGNVAGRLSSLLEKTYSDPTWEQQVQRGVNPFGDGRAGKRISEAIYRELCGMAVGHQGSAR
jgi:UDP-N-acetylglucosamine 2-epimerase (non-hydrolysing)